MAVTMVEPVMLVPASSIPLAAAITVLRMKCPALSMKSIA
jgi:hypothetical protein